MGRFEALVHVVKTKPWEAVQSAVSAVCATVQFAVHYLSRRCPNPTAGALPDISLEVGAGPNPPGVQKTFPRPMMREVSLAFPLDEEISKQTLAFWKKSAAIKTGMTTPSKALKMRDMLHGDCFSFMHSRMHACQDGIVG